MINIICLCGWSGSGKSRLAQHLADNWDFKHIMVSQLVKRLGGNGIKLIDNDKLWKLLRHEVLYTHQFANTDNIVVDGIREWRLLQKLHTLFNYRVIPIKIERNIEMRYECLKERGLTIQQIKEKDRIGKRIGIEEVFENCVVTICNNKSLAGALSTLMTILFGKEVLKCK